MCLRPHYSARSLNESLGGRKPYVSFKTLQQNLHHVVWTLVRALYLFVLDD